MINANHLLVNCGMQRMDSNIHKIYKHLIYKHLNNKYNKLLAIT
jgi:hypothetical protein